jgi:hypothetical protein
MQKPQVVHGFWQPCIISFNHKKKSEVGSPKSEVYQLKPWDFGLLFLDFGLPASDFGLPNKFINFAP